MPDNGIAVEPREAQRPTSLAARTSIAAIPGNGDIAVGAQAGLASLPQGCRSAAPGRLPALHPLIFGGKGNQGYGPARAPEHKVPGWRSVGLMRCLTNESEIQRRFFWRAAFFGTICFAPLAVRSGMTATASTSNNAPSRASRPIWIAVEAGGALVLT